MRRIYWLILLCIAGCSSPYRFQQQVADFNSGVTQLSDGFAASYTQLDSDQAAELRLRLTDAQPAIAIAPSCNLPANNPLAENRPCALFQLGTLPPTLTETEKTRDKSLQGLAVLRRYAQGLAAITAAADRAALDAAVTQLSGSISSLATATAPGGAGTITPVAFDLAGWIVGTALDQERFETLKKAVDAAAQPMRVVAKTLREGLQAIGIERQRVLFKETRDLLTPLAKPLDSGTYRQRLADAQAALSVLDALRRADAAGAANALATAHDALVEAVDNPKAGYAALVDAVEKFSGKAAAVRAAFSASPAPAAASKGG